MTTQIKITQLVDIGANLATTTVLPVVNMTGVATTQKTNLGNVGNTILQGAGTTWKAAALANLAYSVANAAQPNITSVGTLSVDTLHISGGSTGQVLSTDGTGNLAWVVQAGGNTGNIGFISNAIYNLGGVIVENADLSHGATAALIVPNNANTTSPLQLTNSYGNVVITAGINTDTVNWTFDNTGALTVPGDISGANVISATSFVGNGAGLTNLPSPTIAWSVYDFLAQSSTPGVTDTYNAANTSQFITADSNGGFTAYIVLPSAPANGSQYTIKKASTFGSHPVSISAAGGKSIDGSTSPILFNNAWGYITVVYDSGYSGYFIIAQNTTYTP